DAGVDVEVMLTEGALLLRRAAEQPGLPPRAITALLDGAAGLDDDARPAHARLAAGLTEGALLLRRAAEQPGLPPRAITALLDGAAGLDDDARPAHARLAAGIDPSIGEIFRDFPLRDLLSASAEYPLIVHRKE